MYSNLLTEIVCKEYEYETKRNYPNNKALIVNFSLFQREEEPIPFTLSNVDNDRYPSWQLLIFGEYNYTGVFLKDRMLHPKKESDWYCIACHDSCWRSDGVRDFFWHAERFISTFGHNVKTGLFAKPLQFIELSEEEIKHLKDIEKTRLDRKNPRIHPLFKRNK